MKHLMLLLLVALTSSCIGGPDRWFTSVSRGEGDYDGSKGLDLDSEETTFEVGLSGPIGHSDPPDRRYPVYYQTPPPPAELPPQQPATPVAGSPVPADTGQGETGSDDAGGGDPWWLDVAYAGLTIAGLGGAAQATRVAVRRRRATKGAKRG